MFVQASEIFFSQRVFSSLKLGLVLLIFVTQAFVQQIWGLGWGVLSTSIVTTDPRKESCVTRKGCTFHRRIVHL